MVEKYKRGHHPNSSRFKGDDAGYHAIHFWVKNHKPKSEFCECCGERKKVELANISGEYNRDINDFEWLCRKCHMHKDNRAILVKNNLKQYNLVCLKCKGKIDIEKDKYVKISTMNIPNKPNDHVYFHFQHWSDFFQESVNNKARAEVEKMRLVAFNLLENPMIRSVVERIGGGEQLSMILGKPLIPPQIINITPVKKINKKEVAKRIEDDRKKRARKTKRRSK